MIVARDRDYPDLLSALRGRKVYVWTCNTCARLCNGVGGKDSAAALAEKLSGDGIEVVGTGSTSASCLCSKVEAAREGVLSAEPDIIVSLTCSAGSVCASDVFGGEVLNPVETFGFGIIDGRGVPVLLDGCRSVPVGELSSRTGPY